MRKPSARSLVLQVLRSVHPQISKKAIFGRLRKEIGGVFRELWGISSVLKPGRGTAVQIFREPSLVHLSAWWNHWQMNIKFQ